MADASDALRVQGIETLVIELLQDRWGRHSPSSISSWLKTWGIISVEAFREADPPPLLLHSTVCTVLVRMGPATTPVQSGWTFSPVQSIAYLPDIMLCDRCLRVQRAAALQRDLADAEISGDEF